MLQTINYELTISMQLKANIRSGSVDEMGTPPQIWFVVQSHVGGIPHWTRLVEMSITRFLLVHDSPEIILSILQNGDQNCTKKPTAAGVGVRL